MAGALSLLPRAATAQTITIAHDGVDCIQAGKFPQFFARFDPKDAVSRARLHFRPSGWPHWYSVPMKLEGANFVGVLPKPEKSLTKIEYYLSVTDQNFGESRSEDHAPVVVSGPAACEQKKVLAAGLSRAGSVIVSPPQGIAGLPKVPLGFSGHSVVAGTSGTGSTAAAGAGSADAGPATATTAAAATGGGIGTTALVVGGVVVAGGAGAAVALKGGSVDRVLTYAIEGFACRTLVQTCDPAQGAVVSNSLDSVTTTTDAQGRFTLVPTTPCHISSDPRGSSGGVVFTVTIAAPGCPSANFTRQWGCATVGQFQPGNLNLNCP
jgi:hypothetical protein